MGVFTYNHEFSLPVAASRLFKANHLEAATLVPIVSPHAINSIVIVQGDGGVGSVRETNFADGLPVKKMVHRLDELDVANNTCKYTMIGKEPKSEEVELIVHEVKMEDGGEGCIVKLANTFHTKGEYVPLAERIKLGQEKAFGMHKALADYLVSHPDVCA